MVRAVLSARRAATAGQLAARRRIRALTLSNVVVPDGRGGYHSLRERRRVGGGWARTGAAVATVQRQPGFANPVAGLGDVRALAAGGLTVWACNPTAQCGRGAK